MAVRDRTTEFRILGPFEAHEDGRQLEIGVGKQRALLALLLLSRGEVVSTDRVIDALWGDRPPASALNSVRVYVSHLRRSLGSERLVTRGRGYVLTVDPGQLDLDRFERLVVEGREALSAGDAGRAAETLRAALALWRGPPLVDFATESFVQAEISRLEELRLSAVEERIEADLAAGRDAELVAELEALVRAHPLRERLRAQLMLALYRSGRQAEALEAYQGARRALVEELGLEPGRRLQELERAILSQDRRLDPPRRTAVAGRRGRRPSGVLVAVGGGLLLAAATAVALIEVTGRGGPGLSSARANAVAVVDARSDRLVADVPVGNGPTAVAASPGAVWVGNAQEDTVVRIDPRTTRVVGRIPVGSQPSGIAVGSGAVWVANLLDGTVSRIDPRTNAVVQRIPVGVTPTAVAAGGGAVWVTSADERNVTRVDAVNGHVVETIPTDAVGRGVAVGAGSVWVTDESSRSVVRVDPGEGRVMQTVSVGNGPTGIAFGAGAVWVANSLDGTVSRIDPRTTTVTATIPVGEGPDGIAAGSEAVWVSTEFSRSVVRIDPAANRVAERIPVGNRPKGLAASGNRVFLAVQPSGAGHRGGRLVVAFPRLLESIDPGLTAPLDLAYDALIGPVRRGGSEGTQIVPDLAVALPAVATGGTSYAFRLRRGLRYSNGTPVEASDLRRAIERFFRARTFRAAWFTSLVGGDTCSTRPARCHLGSGVRTDDETGTIVFRLRRPDAEFLSHLAETVPVPVGTPEHDVGTRPVPSTGPYMIASYVPGREVRLVRNPYFRVWSRVARPDGFPDEIELRLGVDGDAAVESVEHGRADVSWSVPVDRLEEVETRYASQLHVNPAPATVFFLFMNTRLPPFDDVRVRRAVNYAVDRAAVARSQGGPELAGPLCQIRPPSVAGHRPYCPYTVDPTAAGEWKAPDRERARRLVAASGTIGTKVVVWTFPQVEPAARELAVTLTRLGYRTSLRRVGIDAYFRKVLDERTHAQAGLFGWIGATGALPSSVLPLLTCGSIMPGTQNQNPSFYCNRRIDAQIRTALRIQAVDPDAAVRLWPRIERELVDEAPWAPLFTPRRAFLVGEHVGNYQYNPASGLLLDQLWVH